MKDTVDTITLPNGGVVQLDKLAYKALQGCSNTYDYHKMSVFLTICQEKVVLKQMNFDIYI